MVANPKIAHPYVGMLVALAIILIVPIFAPSVPFGYWIVATFIAIALPLAWAWILGGEITNVHLVTILLYGNIVLIVGMAVTGHV